MWKSRGFGAALVAVVLLNCPGPVRAQSSQQFESVIIETAKPYTKLMSDIKALGGSVKYQYKYVDAVAANIPRNAMPALRTLIGPANLIKDVTVPAPRGAAGRQGGVPSGQNLASISGRSASLISDLSTVPAAAYLLNNLGLNVRDLHARGFTGAGVVVAVVDSGVRPNYPVLDEDHSVIGGVDFVGDGLGFSNSQNDPHGTFVSGLISGNTRLSLGNPGDLAGSIQQHFPGALIGSDLPLIGTAPSASIYAVRVFGANALLGAPESRIIAAIDYIIDLRQKFLRREPGGVNIQICNLSLGNATLYAGRDVFDRSVDALLANGIVTVIAAGDAGPSGLTVASPATSFSGIAVGSASAAANERVEQDVLNFLGYGKQYRPSDATQVAWFSARGPNADGRAAPDVIANGEGNFGQGYGSANDVSINSGTSFSAPLVAGVAALLRQAFPSAGAAQIRNAIIASASPALTGTGFTFLDRGTGFPDAQKAISLLAANISGSISTSKGHKDVAKNLKQGIGLPVSYRSVLQSTGNLAPGQRLEILYNISQDTSKVVISLSNFNASFNNPASQNAFTEGMFLDVHSAKTSQIGSFGDYFDLGDPFTTGGTFTVNNPESGVMRVTVSGSWTNAGKVSATVGVSSFSESVPKVTTGGHIQNHEQIVFPITISPGVSRADFLLMFREDWGNYPTSDLDMIVYDPNLNAHTEGASLNDPETFTIANPAPGTWLVLIDGFNIASGSDKFELRVSLDGKVVR